MIKYCRYYDEENKTENVVAYSTLDGMDKEVEEKHTFNGNKVLKFADNIEELCSNFVITNREYKVLYETSDYYYFRNFYLDHKWQIDKGLTGYCRYYGAIGTDKGLIYVAKMNEKGELELL